MKPDELAERDRVIEVQKQKIVSLLQESFPSEKRQAYKKLYTLTNKLMADVGCHGEIEINTLDDVVCGMMDALFTIDGGTPDDDKHGFS